MKPYIPTSEFLRGLLDEAPADCVTLGWLLGKLPQALLRHRSAAGADRAGSGNVAGCRPAADYSRFPDDPGAQESGFSPDDHVPELFDTTSGPAGRSCRAGVEAHGDDHTPVLEDAVRSGDPRGRAGPARADKRLLRAVSTEQHRTGRDDHADRFGLSRRGGGMLVLSLAAAAAVLFVATSTIWQSIKAIRFMAS